MSLKEWKQTFNWLLLTALVLGGIVLNFGTFTTPEPQMMRTWEYEKKPILSTVFKEPLIIEKEVIVYETIEVEPEEEVKPIKTYENTAQALNGQFNIVQPSNLTVDEIAHMLRGPRANLQAQAQAIYDAEQVHGINALYLTAVLGLESGWGRHESGTNNIAGWKGGPGGTWSSFSSREECIMTIAESLSTSFVASHGPTLAGVTSRYCPEPGYLNMTLQIMGDLHRQL